MLRCTYRSSTFTDGFLFAEIIENQCISIKNHSILSAEVTCHLRGVIGDRPARVTCHLRGDFKQTLRAHIFF
jgi:hypothetical protein